MSSRKRPQPQDEADTSDCAEVKISSRKRPRPQNEPNTSGNFEAALFNARVLRKLQKALANDPEVDITTLLPMDYSARLANRKTMKMPEQEAAPPTPPEEAAPPTPPKGAPDDRRLLIRFPSQPANIVHPLSDLAKAALGCGGNEATLPTDVELIAALVNVLTHGELLWRSKSSPSSARYVVKCGDGLVIKCVGNNTQEFTEYTSMQFLAKHKPQMPIPRPHGLIISGSLAFIFMTYMPGSTLAEIWNTLDRHQKMKLSDEINGFFLDLRQLECPPGNPLGGVEGEGCKDARRNIKLSDRPIYTGQQLWNFMYSDPCCRSEIYIKFLRDLTQPFQCDRCVFTHGDVHPTNIMVERRSEDGQFHLKGVIDWERSGFYPEDFECIKVTNNLATNEINDWYLYLPACIAPSTHPLRWLADARWDIFVA